MSRLTAVSAGNRHRSSAKNRCMVTVHCALLLVAIALLTNTAIADLGDSVSRMAERAGGVPYSGRAWKVPKLQVYAHRYKDLLNSIGVVGFSDGRAVIQLVFLTAEFIDQFPADQVSSDIVTAFGGGSDWTQRGNDGKYEFWTRANQTAFFARGERELILRDETWAKNFSSQDIQQFISDAILPGRRKSSN
jgi:hypothetical protein